MVSLNYDDNAAAFFGVTLLTIYIVPASIYIVRSILKFKSSGDEAQIKARTKAEEAQFKKLQDEQRSKRVLWTPGFKVFTGVTIAAVLLLLVMVYAVQGGSELAQYDPFAILGVSPSASDREIKGAYRKLSLQHHPDKPGGDAEMFQKVAKAYEALTDPEARKNYELYGNPDGRQALEVSIGLPHWLTEGASKYLLVSGYLLVLVVLVPWIMWKMHKANKDSSIHGKLENATVAWIVTRIEPGMPIGRLFDCIAGAKEAACPDVPMGPEDSACLTAINEWLVKEKRIPGPPPIQKRGDQILAVIHPNNIMRNYILLFAHMNKRQLPASLPKLTPGLQKVLDTMLQYLDMTTEVMLKVCIERTQLWQQQEEMRRRRMKIQGQPQQNHMDLALQVMEVKQMLTQCVVLPMDHPLRQLLPEAASKQLAALPKKGGRIDSLLDYLRLPAHDRPAYIGPGSGAGAEGEIASKQELDAVLADLPNLQVDLQLAVEGEEYVAERDIITASVTLKHLNMLPAPAADACCPPTSCADKHEHKHCGDKHEHKHEHEHSHDEIKLTKRDDGHGHGGGCCGGNDGPVTLDSGAKVPPVFAPLFPFPRTEEWQLFLLDNKDRLVAEHKVTNLKAITAVKLMFQAPEAAGKYEYVLHVKSGSYAGLDQEIRCVVEVRPASEVPAYQEDKEDAAELGKRREAALEDMLQGGKEDESDYSDEEEDEEVKGAKSESEEEEEPEAQAEGAKKAAPKRAAKKKPAAKKPKDDEEDDWAPSIIMKK